MRWFTALLPLALALAFSLGCGDGTPTIPPPPSYDPEAMAKAALKDYDKDSNGLIEGPELEAVPALKGALTPIDKNQDKKLSKDELKDRFEAYKSLGAGAVAAPFEVMFNGEPLEGATVTFTPEGCMLGTVKTATTTTTANGNGSTFMIDAQSFPGIPSGLYKISISKKDASGNEILPERYNKSSSLGGEVFDGNRGSMTKLTFNLNAK